MELVNRRSDPCFRPSAPFKGIKVEIVDDGFKIPLSWPSGERRQSDNDPLVIDKMRGRYYYTNNFFSDCDGPWSLNQPVDGGGERPQYRPITAETEKASESEWM